MVYELDEFASEQMLKFMDIVQEDYELDEDEIKFLTILMYNFYETDDYEWDDRRKLYYSVISTILNISEKEAEDLIDYAYFDGEEEDDDSTNVESIQQS